MGPPSACSPGLPSSPTALPRIHLWRARSRNEALGPDPKKVESDAEILEMIKSLKEGEGRAKTSSELAGLPAPAQDPVLIGGPPEPANSINPISPRPFSRSLNRAPGVSPCTVGPAEHYREWHRRAIGMESIHAHKGLHTWGTDPELPEEVPVSDAIPAECIPTRYATAELIAACMVSTKKDRLEATISRPIGVGRAGHDAGWAKHAAESELESASTVASTTNECLRMAHEDLLSSWYGQQCAEQARKANKEIKEKTLTCTFHAIYFQSQLRSWLARIRCTIKQREQKRLWQELRRQKGEEKRLQELAEAEAKKAEAARAGEPTQDMLMKKRVTQMAEAYFFKEEEFENDDSSSAPSSPSRPCSPTTPPSSRPQSPGRRFLSTDSLGLSATVVAECSESQEDICAKCDDAALGSTHEGPLASTQEDPLEHLSLDELLLNPLSPFLSPMPSSPTHDAAAAAHVSPYLRKARDKAVDARQQHEEDRLRSKAQVEMKMKALQRTQARAEMARKTVHTIDIEALQDVNQQPSLNLSKSIKFTQSEEASLSLREVFSVMTSGSVETKTTGPEFRDMLKDKYMHSCQKWGAKPNSQVLRTLASAEGGNGKDSSKMEIQYDFSNAHLGDRGVVCLLHALARDSRITSLSLRGCCLRGGSAATVAVFVELHPKLRDVDLSCNNLSYEFGEQLVAALETRERQFLKLEKRKEELAQQMRASAYAHKSRVPFHYGHEVNVNLADTWFTWGAAAGYTVGPPSGNLWASLDHTSTKFAPFGYEKLRERLESDCVKWKRSVVAGTESKDVTAKSNILPAVVTGNGRQRW